MSLSLKANKTYLTSKGIEMPSAFLAMIEADYRKRNFLLGVFVSKGLFTEKFALGEHRKWVIDSVEITMTPTHFIQYFYTDITKGNSFKPLDLMNELFNQYLLTEKPRPNGKVDIPDPEEPEVTIEDPNGKMTWDDWEEDGVVGIPATRPGTI